MSSLSLLIESVKEDINSEGHQLFESDCELASDRSRSPSPILVKQSKAAEMETVDTQEQQAQKQVLTRYAQPLSELLERIQQDLKDLEQRRTEQEEEEEEEGQQQQQNNELFEKKKQELKMMQQEIARTHKFITTVSETTEITEEVFSSVRRKAEEWLNNNTDSIKKEESTRKEQERKAEDRERSFSRILPSPSTNSSSSASLRPILSSPSVPTLEPQWISSSPQGSPQMAVPQARYPGFASPHLHVPQQPYPMPSFASHPSNGWGAYPFVLPLPVPSGMPLPYHPQVIPQQPQPQPQQQQPQHRPLHIPTLVPTSAQAAYFQLKEPKDLPSLRDTADTIKKENVSKPQSPAREGGRQDYVDKLSYLVHSASELSEQFEREANPDVIEDSAQPSANANSEEGAQLLLSKLAEICKERAESEASQSSGSDEAERSEKKRKRREKSEKKKKKKKRSKKDKKSKKRKLDEEVKEEKLPDIMPEPDHLLVPAHVEVNGKERKSPRRTKTPEQLEILEREYLISIFPSTAKRLQISKQTGLTPRGVQIWFQNKRAKDKANKRIQRGPQDSPQQQQQQQHPQQPQQPHPSSPHQMHSSPLMPSSAALPTQFPFAPMSQHPHHQHAQFPQHLPPFVGPSSSPLLPTVSGVKPVLPPPAALVSSYASYGVHSHPSAHPFCPSPYNIPPQTGSASVCGGPEKPEIWQGTLSWQEHQSENVSGPSLATVALSARAHEWSEPSHFVRECPKQLLVAGFAPYEQHENSFRRAATLNSIIDFYPCNENARAPFEAFVQTLGTTKSALVYLGGKGLLLASNGRGIFGCLSADIPFGW